MCVLTVRIGTLVACGSCGCGGKGVAVVKGDHTFTSKVNKEDDAKENKANCTRNTPA